ncbi:hypothetical protein [Mechercharimyces sp. CAU 1602]|uniref:hypothetical protein n=1 Tax=Mechercharimyces sp. CAU 1602 TaxID=2973933 RepID=UPI0021617BF4|nr:hypothetical protein [Mechercharimyces sp. CAU 1602]MCS1350296.1 hypothetical protein [Mechercharimyces sp. CAU 1602]
MVSKLVKSNIKLALRSERERTISELRDLFRYPFHSDVKILHFEMDGSVGDYGITVAQFKELDEIIEINAHGEKVSVEVFLK